MGVRVGGGVGLRITRISIWSPGPQKKPLHNSVILPRFAFYKGKIEKSLADVCLIK